ncbi:hypothetical protein ACFWWA_13065 [Streptomyces goshikiensis]|uniref:hypothetical protein n=1 Tax=Streptomyces goshikiensis TaxID=1942 RepID=UPI00364AB168
MPKRKRKTRGRRGLDCSDGSPRAKTSSVPPPADEVTRDRGDAADCPPRRP